MSEQRFAGRVAFVTGAASGLGKATALKLAREGARLMLFDRDAKGLQDVQAQCPGSVSYVGDASSSADVNAAAAASREALGPAEFLVTSAGINGIPKMAVDYTEEEWDKLFDVNVKGSWLAVKALVPQMRELGKGSIVLMSSTAGLGGSKFLAAYSASKGAVTMLARSLALNHAHEGIRVNCVCPGTIDTPMAQEMFVVASQMGGAAPPTVDQFRTRIPMGRFGLADEIGDAVLYFLSDAASYTTGVTMPVDGGLKA
ncbi:MULTISPECIES: SDR family NAD(P)-dependent oxidoreductase [unclassified Bordetella]|uniref:SDR family NAD(P)-dependent oxidoreductase n=1 Tax=unclassified Bordetella TaxID=2630031 RepID=UPI00132B2D85|nr:MULTISPECIES: SDR family oxidoreductase [unclassified Bordetella]MVW70010.1 glucose 1-dehydrogenase [Bordetella sp. 15P40C-2]MVW78224.1 glucose 1-dehydrogenase [Bordetella sp. 02P26C-1]